MTELNKDESVKEVRFTFRLDFFNIASSKRILFILYRLAEMQKNGKFVQVKWMYEDVDDDMLEIGEDYETMVQSLKFDFESYVAEEIPEPIAKFG